MAALTRGLELLESAVGYALASTAMVRPHSLSRPTPCPAWDLAMLLSHVSDSAGALNEALTAGRIGTHDLPAGSDPILVLRGQLAALLACMAPAGPADRPVAIGDHELAASMAAVAGAIEIAVHGWDIAVACGRTRPIPPRLAAALLAMAPLLVPAASRPGLFADPVRLPGLARAEDQLIAFLGRRPLHGDSEGSAWSA